MNKDTRIDTEIDRENLEIANGLLLRKIALGLTLNQALKSLEMEIYQGLINHEFITIH